MIGIKSKGDIFKQIYGLESLVAKGKITEKQAEKIMLEFVDRAVKLEKEE